MIRCLPTFINLLLKMHRLCLFLYIIVYVMFFGAGIVIPIFRDFRAIFGVFRIEQVLVGVTFIFRCTSMNLTLRYGILALSGHGLMQVLPHVIAYWLTLPYNRQRQPQRSLEHTVHCIIICCSMHSVISHWTRRLIMKQDGCRNKLLLSKCGILSLVN